MPSKINKMEWVYKLFKYRCTTYCQGTADRGEDYALLHVPEDATFSNNKSTLFQAKHRAGVYEIDYDSIEDMTVRF